MNRTEELAVQLRQSVQGCSVHSHGPVQAWAAIVQAREEGAVIAEEVARLAVSACTRRIEELLASGVRQDDLRIRKETLTRAFMEKLLR